MWVNVLDRFPAGAHSLVLAHDPDHLLDDPEVRKSLTERGYRWVDGADDFGLWADAAALRPWSAQRPVLIVTTRRLNELPYDLWAQAHRVELSLEQVYPMLSLSVIRALSPAQRHRLDDAETPTHKLGRTATIRHVLQHVFDLDEHELEQAGVLLLWLNRIHAESEMLPEIIREHLVMSLGRLPAYYGWPLGEILTDRQAFGSFLRRAWDGYVGSRTSAGLHEPAWGTLFDDERVRAGLGSSMQFAAALGVVESALARPGDWRTWCKVAWSWAEAARLHYGAGDLGEHAAARYLSVATSLDKQFLGWLTKQYGALAGQRLPIPHHLFHVPGWMAYRRGKSGVADRAALIVLDGMALCDWLSLRDTWHGRWPDWRFEELLVMAQVPTITSVSRQALVSGQRPAELGDLTTNAHEPQLWRSFWLSRGLDESRVALESLSLDRLPPPEAVTSSRVAALCLIDHSVDELSHGASLGAAQAIVSLSRWLQDYAPRLEAVIETLLQSGYAIYLTSDHGHVEAIGMGRPNEGILAETRGQRVRMYGDAAQAANAHAAFADTVIWHEDGLFPEGSCVLLADGRKAFATFGDRVVTHGGLTIEEVLVPLVYIRKVHECH